MTAHTDADANVEIRRLESIDDVALERFYAGLDPETRRLRFHAATAGLSNRESAWFCRPDRDRHEGFVAEASGPDGQASIVGHLCVEPEPRSRSASRQEAEIALVVSPAHQGRGIGRRMTDAAVAWARRDGIAMLTATVLDGNEPIRRLLTTLGLPTQSIQLGAGTCELRIDLARAAGADRSVAVPVVGRHVAV